MSKDFLESLTRVGVIELTGQTAAARFVTRMNAAKFLECGPLLRESVQQAFIEPPSGVRLTRELVVVQTPVVSDR